MKFSGLAKLRSSEQLPALLGLVGLRRLDQTDRGQNFGEVTVQGCFESSNIGLLSGDLKRRQLGPCNAQPATIQAGTGDYSLAPLRLQAVAAQVELGLASISD